MPGARNNVRWLIGAAILIIGVAGAITGVLYFREGTLRSNAPPFGPGPQPGPPPITPDSVKVRRYPSLDAPDRVAAGKQFALQVSLTMEPASTGVQVQPGPHAEAAPDGRLAMTLPPRTDNVWPIDVVLSAPDFEVAGGTNQATLSLPLSGDSTPALFKLTLKPGRSGTAPAKISVTFWADGAYLARATRVVAIDQDQPAPASSGRATVSQPATLDTGAKTPDLTVYVQESRIGGRTVCQLTIESPFLQPATGTCIPADELRPWLSAQYAAILRASQRVRGVKAAGSSPAPANNEEVLALMRGIGREVYRRAAGPLFSNAFWKLVDREQRDGHPFRSIQIYTNNPALPWELMVPSDGERSRQGFLATEFDVARWHIDDEVTAHDKPAQHLNLIEIAAIAPSYSGALALPYQSEELSTLKQMAGFRQIEGQFAGVRQLLADPPAGIVHFAGHGTADPASAGTVDYALQLENNAAMSLATWRGLMHDNSAHHPLYFVNACDVGQANRIMNFVDGWAPTVLDNGGSGFIGALWPLSDKGASAFAARFYEGLKERTGGDESAQVTELLKASRQDFFTTGDPTFLGYVFYGDVALSISRPQPGGERPSLRRIVN